MAILRELALAQREARESHRTLLPPTACRFGCYATATRMYPCPWHTAEFRLDLRALTENDVDCQEACCDPA